MHGPGTGNIQQVPVHFGRVVISGGKGNDYLIEFQTFCQVHCAEDYAP